MEAATMTSTLNLFDEILSRARRLQIAGQWREALTLLRRLSGFPNLPPRVAEKAEALQGEILLKRRRYRQARKHLRSALAYAPDRARYHFLLGLALHRDPKGDKGHATAHYERCLELAPALVRCRGQAGLLAIECGRVDEGLALLRLAVEQAPGDSDAVSRLVKGLCLAGWPEEAQVAVRTARFASPRCPRLRKLSIDLRLADIRRRQDLSSASAHRDKGPVLLPFLSLSAASAGLAPSKRYDAETSLPGPHLVRLRRRVDRRRAP
jgi:tetratricopeptide (TPR) repeat protein